MTHIGVLAALLALALALAPPQATARASGTEILRIAWWTDVGFPTPFAVSAIGPGGAVRVSLLYDTLVWKDERGLIPWLAESWRVSADGRVYTFTLRDDVVWHDGVPLTARDVQFTFAYYRAHRYVWADTDLVTAVETSGPRTVVIRLRQPFAPFLDDVAGVTPIVPAHVWATIQEPSRSQTLAVTVGTGPYRLADYRRETGETRLVANPRYFKGRPTIDEIRYVTIPSERQMLSVHSGQVDVAMTESRDAVETFARHPHLRVWQSAPLSVVRLAFNLDRPPFDRIEVRRAIAHAINRTQLATVAAGDAGLPGNPGLVASTDLWYAPPGRTYPYDPTKARGVLAGDGGAAPEILTSASPMAAIIQSMLRASGIDLAIRAVDARTRAALVAEGKYQVALISHVGAGGDPDYLRRWLTGREPNLFGQTSAFRHAEFQRLAAAQAGEMDPGARRVAVARMQAIIAGELPTLALYNRRLSWVYDSRKLAPIGTRGGLLSGIPLIENKIAFLNR